MNIQESVSCDNMLFIVQESSIYLTDIYLSKHAEFTVILSVFTICSRTESATSASQSIEVLLTDC